MRASPPTDDAEPRRNRPDRHARERDQPARELLDRDEGPEAEPEKAEQQSADRRGTPGPPQDHFTVASADRLARWLEDAERVDVALYAAIAQTPTPALDRAMARLSDAADYSRLSLTAAAALAVTGGRRGRRAAAIGPRVRWGRRRRSSTSA